MIISFNPFPSSLVLQPPDKAVSSASSGKVKENLEYRTGNKVLDGTDKDTQEQPRDSLQR